jgi:hypothetical protein
MTYNLERREWHLYMKNVFALMHEVFHYCVLSNDMTNDMKTGFNTTTNN